METISPQVAHPEPTPEQAVRVLRILGEWTKRGWWYQVNISLDGGAVVDFTDPTTNEGGSDHEAKGIDHFDALCQATTVMQVLLEEHPEKPRSAKDYTNKEQDDHESDL
jgi:hypothetical protein